MSETVEQRLKRLNAEYDQLKHKQHHVDGFSMEERRQMMERRKRLACQIRMLSEDQRA